MLLHEKLATWHLLLASQSPRRRELMSGCGIPYELAPRYACEECYPATLPAEEVPAYLARLKSEAYPTSLAPRDLLLTADTVVILDGAVLGKPADRNEARQILGRLSGARHTVITGGTLRSATTSNTFSARSEIDYYIDHFRPYDKAGSYGIQEWIGYAAIERIDGSFYNVMGLPIQRVYIELEKFINAHE